ncbi:hypothetical protein Z585_02532, partial [Mycobacterium tuberculosis D 4155]
YLLDEPPDMTPSFPRTGVSGHAGAVQESGDLSHTELGTLQAYVAALGGHLRIVAEFGENTVELTA